MKETKTKVETEKEKENCTENENAEKDEDENIYESKRIELIYLSIIYLLILLIRFLR